MFSEEELLRPSSSENADARKVAVAVAGATAFADTAGRRGAPPEKSESERMLDDIFGEK